MIGLFRDSEGKIPYDDGRGKNLIEVVNHYYNGKLEKVTFSDCFLVVKGEYKNVVLRVVNKGKSKVLITNNIKNGYKEVLELGDVKDDVFKFYFKVEGKGEPNFSLFLECEEIK